MGNSFSFKSFRPAIFFILKFLGIYLVGNICYGIFITHYEPRPDPVTINVTSQVSSLLNLIDQPVTLSVHLSKPTVSLVQKIAVISVYEGCNGINVMIVFLAFIFAYGPLNKKLIWFVPLGIVIIHLANLLRIALLFFVSKHFAYQLYFLHKYFFTAFIYAVVFALWYYWLKTSQVPDHGHAE